MKLRFAVPLLALVALLPTAAAFDVTIGVRHGLLPVDVAPVDVKLADDSSPPSQPAQPGNGASASSGPPSHASTGGGLLDQLPPAPILVDFKPVTSLVGETLDGAVHALPAPRAAGPAAPPAPPAKLERVYVGHDKTAAQKTDIITPGAALAAVAAVTAAGPAVATLGWERLRRFAPLVVLYTRIAKERLLDHGARERLLAVVRARPGIALADAAREATMPRNTAVYHLARLEKEGLVASQRAGRARLYFAPGGLQQRENATALAALRHPVTLDIATQVGAEPGLDQHTLCERFGIAPSLAHWHAARLMHAGIVRSEREGRRVRYYPGAQFGLVADRGWTA